jgi:Ni,Fe-hydrogenase III large subunit
MTAADIERPRQAIEALRARIRGGARLAWIFGEETDLGILLHYVLCERGILVDTPIEARGALPSLTTTIPAANWYERELRDRFQLRFEGLVDRRPLIDVGAAEDLRHVESPEVSTVLYGPIRSGIVESARWIVETAGEDFIDVQPSMFFKHRGVEKRFEGTRLELAPYIAEHCCGATASSHASAFCKAAEQALGVSVPIRARAGRAVLVELERIHQHLDSLAKLADDGSLSVGSAQAFAAKERIHRLLSEATGNRFARGAICVGGVRNDVVSELRKVCGRDLDRVERHARSVLGGLMGTQSLLDRLIGTGRISRESVVAFGAVGPVARGSGVSGDVRAEDGYLFRPLVGEESLEENGDAVSRALVRVSEIYRSFQLIRNALDANPPGPYCGPILAADGRGLGRVESPQGELIYFVRIANGLLERVAIRSASYANWPLFVPSLPGNIFTDFSFIEHSFGALQSEVDR